MTRWVIGRGYTETPKVDAFIADLKDVCRKHRMFLGHEDSQGAFEVGALVKEDDLTWLGDAHVLESVRENRL